MEVRLDAGVRLVSLVDVWVGRLVDGEDEGLRSEEAAGMGGVAGEDAHSCCGRGGLRGESSWKGLFVDSANACNLWVAKL